MRRSLGHDAPIKLAIVSSLSTTSLCRRFVSVDRVYDDIVYVYIMPCVQQEGRAVAGNHRAMRGI